MILLLLLSPAGPSGTPLPRGTQAAIALRARSVAAVTVRAKPKAAVSQGEP